MSRPGEFRAFLPRGGSALILISALTGSLLLTPRMACAADTAPVPTASGAPVGHTFYIKEFRVEGVKNIAAVEIQDAIYRFMGPERTVEDVEQARQTLEKLYRDKGYQAASVQIPGQQVKGGIVFLRVAEGTIAKLRVRDSRYFSPAEIKKAAPALAEGKVLNFNGISRDIVGLNQLPDRRVTPSLSTGSEPGTFDVDLNVKDSLPLHGSLELNNRYSPNTTHLRLNGGVNYSNLWQLGHTLGFNFQLAPERLDDAKIFSGYYLVHASGIPWLSFMVQGTKQDSDISTLGGSSVVGRGGIVGLRAIMTLPPSEIYYHSLTLGIDYKHYGQDLKAAGTTTSTPITYCPLSATYGGSWASQGVVNEFNFTTTLGLRGLGSDEAEFSSRRTNAKANFITFRADYARTQTLPGGYQLYGKLQGQVVSQEVIDTEQFSGGGIGTARGYLEGAVSGDNALFGTVELRSPSFAEWLGDKSGDWRVYAFGDSGIMDVLDTQPEQTSNYTLISAGLGSRIKLHDHFSGSVDAGVPLKSQSTTKLGDLLITFRIGADY